MRTNHPLLPILFIGVALGACAAVERESAACSAPSCWPAAVGPRAGTTVPSNAPAFPVSRDDAFPTVNHDGTDIEFLNQPDPMGGGAWRLAVPKTPLPEGAVSLSYNETCTYGGASAKGWTFNIGPSHPLPTTSGTLVFKNVGVKDKVHVANSSGSCSSDIRALTFDLALKNADNVAAFAAIAGFIVEVDDNGLGISAVPSYGDAKVDADGDLIVAQLHTACGPHEDGADEGLALGSHSFRVTPHIAGSSETIAAATGTFVASCDPNADAGTAAPSTPTITDATDTGSANGTSSDATNSTSGCATTPASGGASGASLLLIALGVIYSRRKRRE